MRLCVCVLQVLSTSDEIVCVAGTENRVPIGILEVQVELFPKLTQVVDDRVVRAQLDLERGRQTERERLFLVYCKQWWKEYLQIRDAHKDRLVKIFAQVFYTNNTYYRYGAYLFLKF